MAGLPADPVLLGFVPRVGLAGAALDAALGSAVLDRLRRIAWLPVAGEDELRQAPDRAAVLDDATDDKVAALAGVLPGLLPTAWSRRSDLPALTALGVRRIGIAEAVEAVRGVARPASWWAALYAALDGADREELAALPVPLADGRTAHGPAGVLLPDPGLPAGRLGPLGLRLADPGGGGASRGAPAARAARRPAGHGGRRSSPTRRCGRPWRPRWTPWRTHCPAPRTRRSWPRRCSRWSAAARPAVGELPWLVSWRCPTTTGDGRRPVSWCCRDRRWPTSWRPARSGCSTGTSRPGPTPTRCARWACSTRSPLVRAEDPDDLDVDGAAEWADAVLDRLPHDGPPPEWPPLIAVRDLELVADWPRALPLLAALPAEARADVVLGGVAAPGYLRWWLSTHAVLGGARPDRLRHPASTELQGLYEPAEADPAVLGLLRPPVTVDDVLARRGRRDRPARPARRPGPHRAAGRAADGLRPARRGPGRHRRATRRSGVRVAPDRVVSDAVVLDAPYLQPLVRCAGRPRRGRARGRRRPARPAAGRRTGPGGGHQPAGPPRAVGRAAGRRAGGRAAGPVRARPARWPCTRRWPSTAGRSPGGRPGTSTTSTAARRPSAGRWPGGPGSGPPPGARRGVRLSRPRRRAGRRGRGRSRPAHWPQRGMDCGARRVAVCRRPAARSAAARTARNPAPGARSSSTGTARASAPWSARRGGRSGAGPPGAASGRRRCPAAGRGAGAEGCAGRGEDGGGEPVERGAVGLGQRGAGGGGGRRDGT